MLGEIFAEVPFCHPNLSRWLSAAHVPIATPSPFPSSVSRRAEVMFGLGSQRVDLSGAEDDDKMTRFLGHGWMDGRWLD